MAQNDFRPDSADPVQAPRHLHEASAGQLGAQDPDRPGLPAKKANLFRRLIAAMVQDPNLKTQLETHRSVRGSYVAPAQVAGLFGKFVAFVDSNVRAFRAGRADPDPFSYANPGLRQDRARAVEQDSMRQLAQDRLTEARAQQTTPSLLPHDRSDSPEVETFHSPVLEDLHRNNGLLTDSLERLDWRTSENSDVRPESRASSVEFGPPPPYTETSVDYRRSRPAQRPRRDDEPRRFQSSIDLPPRSPAKLTRSQSLR
jgi:hypothetical protein